MYELSKLEEQLGFSFTNRELAKQAFTHRSYLNEAKRPLPSNERLEFLGDSVLSFIVSDHLFRTFPNYPEGHLTNLRSTLVKTTMLATISQEINLGEFLFLSRGEEEGGGRKNISLLADTFEALLGATYIDQGFEAASTLIHRFLIPKLAKILEEKSYKDPKSKFQEYIQEDVKSSPLYTVLSETGPDHAKEFTVGVFVSGTLWGQGKGKSKQEAEQSAAAQALEKVKKK